MAEGLLDGMLGETGEKPEVKAPAAVAGAEAFALALAATASRQDSQGPATRRPFGKSRRGSWTFRRSNS
jgi:hypothetical protein